MDSEDERTSKKNFEGDEKITGISHWITKKSLPSKKTVAPIVSASSSNAFIMGFPVDEILRDLHRVSSSHKCTYCGLGGASIGCSRRQCTVEFHMPCGLENGVFFQHFGKFQSVSCFCLGKIMFVAGFLQGGRVVGLQGVTRPLLKYEKYFQGICY